jgi:GntR family transcriptional regulator, transcriptional repressor for pyruvate dehydrogenase complex
MPARRHESAAERPSDPVPRERSVPEHPDGQRSVPDHPDVRHGGPDHPDIRHGVPHNSDHRALQMAQGPPDPLIPQLPPDPLTPRVLPDPLTPHVPPDPHMAQTPPFRRRRQSVSAQVAAYLEERIASGGFMPGERLPPEQELARSLSVSRASLREAMRELQHKHLVERSPGRGTIVIGPPREVTELVGEFAGTRQELRNANELRRLIEPGIAGWAALRARPSNLLRLEDVLRQSNENLSAAESLRLDLAFHSLLAQAAQNPLVAALLTMADRWMEDVRLYSHATPTGRRVSIEGHRAILQAVAAGDATAAQACMRRHLDDVRRLIAERTGTEEEYEHEHDED